MAIQLTLRKTLREPLLHFFLLGTGLFALFAALNRDAMQAPDEIVVDAARITSLVGQYERVWQKAPTQEEVRALVAGWVREEILYREGMALGLDLNDSVVRRRVAQKMEFVADGTVPAEPTDGELEAWLQAHADKYRIEPVYTLRQVYFDPARHDEDLRDHLRALASTREGAALVPEGDATLLPGRLQLAGASEVARTFGVDFAEAVGKLRVGEWQGPVASAYGLHVVKVEQMTPGRHPKLAEVRAQLERDWSIAQSEQLSEALYQAVRARYTVRVEDSGAGGATPSARE
jgi:hypothetical protein